MEAGSKDCPPMLAPGIDNDIYSIVDACPNACEMWKAIKRLKHGESINVHDLETNLYWEFGKSTSHDGESLESYYLRFYKMMNELIRNQCDVTNHQVNVQFLLQLQPEWKREFHKPKRVKDAAYHREKMLLCKQEEAGILLNAKQGDWRDDTDDDELEDQELEAHYIAHPEQSKSVPDTYPIEQDAHNVNQSKYFCKEREQYFEMQDLKAQLQDKGIVLVEIVLFIIDSGCSKHMTGNLKLLIKFMEKFLGTVKFGIDQIAPILSYGDLVQGAVMIKRVYYVEGLNHNLFFVGQFCDADLEVAFRKSTCYIRDLKGNDLLTGSHGTDLYSITLQDTNSPNPICLMAKATSSQAWLWHRRLSHL
nr:integrase, catalytic region, zinc finger, CCHC-type, peptidase aspartic, catalytic [Tanacetum cinerariifolium]